MLNADLELTLRSIEGLLGHQDLVEREQGLIQAGCEGSGERRAQDQSH